MLVRIILFLGFALIAFAGGAVGWQYWQGLPPSATSATEPAPAEATIAKVEQTAAPAQNWLISPGGGLVDRDMVKSYLKQDRYAETRRVDLAFIAPLSALLSEGEALPGPAFRQAFADIRAKALTKDLCAILLAGFAARCDVYLARSPENGLQPSGDTAIFHVSLVYTLKPEATPMPDLSARILRTDYVGVMAQGAGPEAMASPQAFLAHAVAEIPKTCPSVAEHCRVLSMSVGWQSPTEAHTSATIGWLAPLPAGMYPAPPLSEVAPDEG